MEEWEHTKKVNIGTLTDTILYLKKSQARRQQSK